MNKPILIYFLEEATLFLNSLDEKARDQFAKAFNKTKNGFKGDWFLKMSGTDNIWEFRVTHKGNSYRLFAFWDSTGEEQTLIVCTHGLIKKTNRTPSEDIKKAENIKKRYFE